MNTNMNLAIKFLSGFILGGVAGASVALLLAPSSGAELRAQIQSEIERVRSEVSQAKEDRRIELEQQLAALRSPAKPPAGKPA